MPAFGRTYVGGIEVARLVARITPYGHALRRQGDIDTPLDDYVPAGLYQRRELPEGLAHGLERAVYVEMVGRNGGYDRHVGTQPQKRTVKLVGLDGKAVARPEHQIARKVLRYAPEEGAAAARYRTVDPCDEGRGRSLAMRTRHRHDILSLREVPQHLRTLLHKEPALGEKSHLRMVFRHRRRKYRHRRGRITERRGNSLHVVIICYHGTLARKLIRQVRLRAVVTRNGVTLMQKITRQGAHADTPDTEEIYVPITFHPSISFLILNSSATLSFAAATTVFRSAASRAPQHPERPAPRYCAQDASYARRRQAAPAPDPCRSARHPHHAP